MEISFIFIQRHFTKVTELRDSSKSLHQSHTRARPHTYTQGGRGREEEGRKRREGERGRGRGERRGGEEGERGREANPIRNSCMVKPRM